MGFFQAITPYIEIVIIMVMINYLLSFFWNTRSMDLMLGVVAFLFIFALSSWLNLAILHKLMLLVANVAVIAIIIIFQPELRVALSKLSLKGRRYREVTEFDKFLEQFSTSVYKLAEKKTGALIVLEKEDSLDEYAKKSIMLGAAFSSELLESLFSRNSPLHDGAVIISNMVIVAASVILPLAETHQVQRTLGTRHRAAVGMSISTDAVIVVVSEETGKVSIAREGLITRGIKVDRFMGILRSLFCKDTDKKATRGKRTFLQWLKQ